MISGNRLNHYILLFRISGSNAAFLIAQMTDVEKAIFYTSRKWKNFRRRIMARDEWTCQRCKRYGRLTPAREVHHIKHLEDFPELAYDPSNCISLCKACHNMQHPEKGTNSLRRHKDEQKY